VTRPRLPALLILLLVGGCDAAPQCSASHFEHQKFWAIVDAEGRPFVRIDGCLEFRFVAPEGAGSTGATMASLTETDHGPLLNERVFSGVLDGKLVYLSAAKEQTIAVTAVHDLRELSGNEREAVLDSQFWPKRQRDPFDGRNDRVLVIGIN
jgi:hypothetical protein